MSVLEAMTVDDELDALIAANAQCGYCGAVMGQPCHPRNATRKAAYSHADRWESAKRAGIIDRWMKLHEID